MDLSTLSDRELADSLTSLLNTPKDDESVDRLQATVHSLQVHRVELEMQNRALRKMQIELEQMVHRYADLYDNLPVAYLTLTETGDILEANATAAVWLASERAPLIGANLRQYIDPADRDRYVLHLHGCRSASPSVVELALNVADRPVLPVQLSSRLVELPQGERRIHTAITNVAELKRAQRALQDNGREQQAFTYSVSHDVRGPLLTIGSFARILQEDYGRQLDENARTILGRIENAAQRLDDMLRGLLEISRIATDGIELETVELDAIVNDVLLEQSPDIAATKAQVVVDRPLPTARCSLNLTRKILHHLFANALKFVAAGEPPNIRISAETHPYTVVLKIADHGIGMAPQHLDRIFNVFERLHTRSQYPGNGIGLAVVRRAVERMNGRVRVESEVGSGTTVYVELPRA